MVEPQKFCCFVSRKAFFYCEMKIGFVMRRFFGRKVAAAVSVSAASRRHFFYFNISTLIFGCVNKSEQFNWINLNKRSMMEGKKFCTFRFIHFYAIYITLSIEFWSLLSSFSLSVFHARKSQRAYRRWNFHCGTAEISNLHKSTFGAAQRRQKTEEKAFKSAFGTVRRSLTNLQFKADHFREFQTLSLWHKIFSFRDSL